MEVLHNNNNNNINLCENHEVHTLHILTSEKLDGNDTDGAAPHSHGI